MGFPETCVPLPPEADEATIGELCRDWTARLMAWIDQAKAGETPNMPRYDGTVFSACQIYQRHPHSPFHNVKANTRRTYTDSLTLIERTVGKRLIRNLTIFDIQNWHAQWRKPAPLTNKQGEPITDENGVALVGKERIDRAHNAVSMFRTVINFCSKLKPRQRYGDCRALAEDLQKVKFERGGAREEEMTYAHVTAFLRTADELATRGLMPAARALYMSIGVAAQFELLLRQKDIIGERVRNQADLDKALRRGAGRFACPDGTWVGYFTWENIPGWRWRTKTSKSKYRAAADFDLTRYALLHPLLERVPFDERTGAIVKGEGGLPIQERSYRKWYRQIARAAAIPDAVWNMDTRAGGATEADDAGAPIELIRDALTHTNEATTVRYIRRRGSKMDALADVRNRKRAGEDGTA
jgi:hypothetical protein